MSDNDKLHTKRQRKRIAKLAELLATKARLGDQNWDGFGYNSDKPVAPGATAGHWPCCEVMKSGNSLLMQIDLEPHDTEKAGHEPMKAFVVLRPNRKPEVFLDIAAQMETNIGPVPDDLQVSYYA